MDEAVRFSVVATPATGIDGRVALAMSMRAAPGVPAQRRRGGADA
jgi:hypothetical protein